MTEPQVTRTQAHSRCREVPLGFFDEPRGSLCVAEAVRQVPFEIKRVFWVFGIPHGGERAHHADREQHEMLVAVNGAFTVHCDDGRVRTVHRLDSPTCGLLIPEMVWHHLDEFTEGAICLALASGPYDPDGYVCAYEEFRELTAGS